MTIMASTSELSTKPSLLQVVSGVILIFYPFAIYFGLQFGGIRLIAPIIIVLFIIRFYLLRVKTKLLLWVLRLGTMFGIMLATLSWLLRVNHLLLYYPVVVSLLLLIVFGYSLYNPPSIVEQLARLTEPDLPIQAVHYTKRVTQVWCIFFILNAIIATITCIIDNLAYWTLYNGLISYIVIGLLMAGEWLVRKKVRKASL